MAHGLHRWAARYPLIRRVRVWPLCLSVAAAAPFASVEALISTARLSLWVFTLDDLFDEEHVPDQLLDRRAALYRAIARRECEPPLRDSLAVALGDVRDDLARYPLFSAIGDNWVNALCGTIDAMRTEHRWRQEFRRLGPAALPTYKEYLAVGQYSIGAPPHVWAALITTGDPSTPLHLAHLCQMERAASICIRLANDLQSWGKEVAEENVNALLLIGHALMKDGVAPSEARRSAAELARTAMTQSLASLTELEARRRTVSGHPEAAIADIARFVSDFYVHHDYHTFTL